VRFLGENDPQDAGGDGENGLFGPKCRDCGETGEDHRHLAPEFGGRCSVDGCPCDYVAHVVTLPGGVLS
jgi:hypothetical protein